MKYRIVMTNGDSAEAETLIDAFNAAITMEEDSYDAKGYLSEVVEKVFVGDKEEMWAWQAVTENTIEVGARRNKVKSF